jgi:hypothetical protein
MSFLPINVANVKPADDFNYPAGEYILQVKEAKIEPTKDGTGYRFIMKSGIVMGPGPSLEMQNKPLTHSYALTEKSRPFVVRAALACGVTQQQIDAAGGQIDTEWFNSKQYVVRVSMRDNYTNVDRERPLTDWAHGGVAGQPAAAPAAGMAQPGLLAAMPGAAPVAAAPMMAAPPMAAAAPMAATMVAAPVAAPMMAAPVAAVAPAAVAPQPAVGMPAPPPPGGYVPQ